MELIDPWEAEQQAVLAWDSSADQRVRSSATAEIPVTICDWTEPRRWSSLDFLEADSQSNAIRTCNDVFAYYTRPSVLDLPR
ncbi:hypothetical protein BDW42DRAFT_106100 [Aspergillus taichungensis]|uniref:Uncharacterized protein n=1 Tax=Aspergillus taichungensis TaxID=482145 RepID=A0A2J5HU08_9EURO|nr:hypothetical protein BDW42DRAFT_106100 [Aspergillus taichungensis]